MNDVSSCLGAGLFVLFITGICFLGGWFGGCSDKSEHYSGIRARAIEKKKARYHPETGRFEWTDPEYEYVFDNYPRK